LAKKSKNKNLPKWLKSKYFLLGTALVVAALAILGFRTFASGVYIPTPCLGGTIKQGSNNTCVYYAKKALNYSCATNQAITVSNYFNYDTYKRVYGFQWAAKIPQDGVIGPTTWNNLLHYNKEHPAHSLNCGYFTR
jgi:peptidoglycan hydrolase-like protein with peptidoglycan-binding domain